MVECQEFVGKVVSSFKLYEDTIEGPEICIEFTDGTVFSSCLKTSTALEAKVMRNEGGHPRLLRTTPLPLWLAKTPRTPSCGRGLLPRCDRFARSPLPTSAACSCRNATLKIHAC